VNGLIKVEKQFNLKDKTILFFDSAIPTKKFSKLLIDGKEYKPDIVYDLKNGLGVATTGEFEGKEVKFIA
jgi:hypothetical protein